jgi:hypothetical protein
VIATLFWSDTPGVSQNAARLVRFISLLNIFAIIWLEFSLLADVGGALLGLETVSGKTAILVLCSFTVIFFTLKYGLRGFVFADIFQTPLILLGIALLLGGSVWLGIRDGVENMSVVNFIRPQLGMEACLCFVFNVICLNIFQVATTETHWLRAWIFQEKETNLQVRGTAAIAVMWALLIVIGFFAFRFTGKTGEPSIIDFLGKLGGLSPVFLMAFWIGGLGALFTTADCHIYEFLMVKSFNAAKGTFDDVPFQKIKPWLYTPIATVLLAGAYFLIRETNIRFDKLIFAIAPLCLTLLPGFSILIFQLKHAALVIAFSFACYVGCSFIGLYVLPDGNYVMTLLAPGVPVALSVIIFMHGVFKKIRGSK